MRAGSKGVVNKNLKLINNKPLLYYTINQAKKSKIFTKIVISTDSNKIAKFSKTYGAEVFFKRPKKMSLSTSPKIPVVRHALIKSEKEFNLKFDYIFDLDVTSPLRTVNDLQKAFKLFKKNNSDNLISATNSNKSPYFNQIEFKKSKYDVVKRIKDFPKRRQDSPKVYDMNASIYIWKRNKLLSSDNLFTNKTSLYLMPPERSCDIDTQLDFEFVNYMILKNEKK